jgi:tetratricopeptide (TPR) repeat protein
VEEWLRDALQHDPEQTTAHWWLAAIGCLRGDWPALAALATAPEQSSGADAANYLLTAICHLAAGNASGARQACQHLAAASPLAEEAAYVQAWAAMLEQQPEAAASWLTQVVGQQNSPSADHARGLLGGIRFQQQAYAKTAELWKAIAPDRRAAWQLTEPLARTVFLAALTELQQGQYAEAAQDLREAGRLGLRERRLAPLLTLALVKAGQQCLFAATGPVESQPQVSGECL